MQFFRGRVAYFYSASVDSVDFNSAVGEAKTRLNKAVKEKIGEDNFLLEEDKMWLPPPMAMMAANLLEVIFSKHRPTVKCSTWPSSTQLSLAKEYPETSRAVEMDFINLPRAARKLIPIDAVAIRGTFHACYHKELDVTAASVPLLRSNPRLGLVLLLPGRQSEFLAGGLARLEHRLDEKTWQSLERCMIPIRAELRVPTFIHRSVQILHLLDVSRRLFQIFR